MSPGEAGLYRRVTWRLMPLLFFGYVFAFLNRVNVGFAKLEMVADLGFSDTIYGLGAGIFFLGYFIFEVPSNLALHRVGARLWIARIMITWGLISGATIFVHSPGSFYLSRFVLGAAEAGFFPGIILYLTYWFPSQLRAKITAIFMSAIALSGIVGGPISGLIMHRFSGIHGLYGWQWLFILEAIPSVAMGFLILAWLPNSIVQADWLTPEEKTVLALALDVEQPARIQMRMKEVFTHPRLWGFSLIYFAMMTGLYGISFWLPQIMRNSGIVNILSVGLLSAIPYALGATAMILIGQYSDRTGKRRGPLQLCLLAGAAGFGLIGLFSGSPTGAIVGLGIAACGVLSAMPLFWTFPTALLGGAAAAGGIALINSIGNLGGFVCPYMVGALNDATGRQTLGLGAIAGSLVLGGLLAAILFRSADQ